MRKDNNKKPAEKKTSAKKHKCSICGAMTTRNGSYCHACAAKKNREYYYQKKEREKTLDKTGKHRCPYCGKWIAKPGYCSVCIHEGFKTLHSMFGLTNGWDKKPRKKVEIENGWRGRPVAAPGNHSNGLLFSGQAIYTSRFS